MKFNIPSKQLFSNLSVLSKVINSKNTISILDNFLFTLDGDHITVMASDQETTMTARMEVFDAEGEGSFAVNVKNMLELLKELADQPVTFNVDDERFEINLEYLNGHSNFVGIDGAEFPQKDDPKGNVTAMKLPIGDVRKGIERTIFAVGTEEIRRIMMGIYWDIKPESITFVASDTHKLVRYRNEKLQSGVTTSFILPTKPASILNNILAKSEGDVAMVIDEKSASFTTDNFSLTCRFINGRYPNYESVIPKNNPYEMLVDRQMLLNAVRRVSVFASVGGLVKLDLKEIEVKINTQDVDFSTWAEEVIPCDYKGQDMVIGFNDAKVIEILNNLQCDNVKLTLSDPSRAGVFIPEKNEDGEDLLILLMPMMI